MSERKVLNKYHPPDFDPSAVPRLKLPKGRQSVVRLMAPLHMRCQACGEYVSKGRKFNARKETVHNEAYLGLPVFRFCIRCPRCLAEITFKTDPENTDYAAERGATRSFQGEKLLREEEERLPAEREEEELGNAMKVLENRTKDSRLQMEVLENLQELKELNQRQAHLDFESMLQHYKDHEEEQERLAVEEDEKEMRATLERARARRLLQDYDSDKDHAQAPKAKPTDVLQEDPEPPTKKLKAEWWERSIGKLSSKAALSGLVATRKKLDHSTTNGVGAQSGLGGSGVGSQSTEASDASLPSRSRTPASSLLSLLGAYSDSEDSKDG